jgi:hypothetical protein
MELTMQVITVTASFIFSNDCNLDMLTEIATHKDYLAMSNEAVAKLAAQQLKGASKGNGRTGRYASSGVGDLDYAKLRTIIVNKLQDSPDQGDAFKTGAMQFEMHCLPDIEPDINAAGANKQGATRKQSSTLAGPYTVVKQGVKCTADSDPDKFEIWQHVWTCHSFEEYFAKAPKKGVTKTGRIITASSEMRWAVKCGWIKPTQQ